jgi:glycosyltransferase involved in cell wall biosynthesis
MPVYNEGKTFDVVMNQLLEKEIPGLDIDIVIVESNSTDGTREDVLKFADHPRVRIVLEDRPSGKGHAVRAGLAAASGDFVLIQDADLEYDMDDYEAILEPLRRLETGFVLGIRTRTDGAKYGVRHFEHEALTSQIMNIGNTLFLGLFNLIYQSRLKDPFTMYKVIRLDCLYGMRLESNRFDFDWELTAKLLRAGYKPVEVPVSYQSRSFSEGKKISVFKDPLTWVIAAFKYRFASFEN